MIPCRGGNRIYLTTRFNKPGSSFLHKTQHFDPFWIILTHFLAPLFLDNLFVTLTNSHFLARMWSYWERFIWFTPLLYQGYRDWHSHRARAKRGQAGAKCPGAPSSQWHGLTEAPWLQMSPPPNRLRLRSQVQSWRSRSEPGSPEGSEDLYWLYDALCIYRICCR